jgi:hypothetical protein
VCPRGFSPVYQKEPFISSRFPVFFRFGLLGLGRWLCFGINLLAVLTPGLPVSTSSSTPNGKHHISHDSRVDDRKGMRPCRQEKMGW